VKRFVINAPAVPLNNSAGVHNNDRLQGTEDGRRYERRNKYDKLRLKKLSFCRTCEIK